MDERKSFPGERRDEVRPLVDDARHGSDLNVTRTRRKQRTQSAEDAERRGAERRGVKRRGLCASASFATSASSSAFTYWLGSLKVKNSALYPGPEIGTVMYCRPLCR